MGGAAAPVAGGTVDGVSPKAAGHRGLAAAPSARARARARVLHVITHLDHGGAQDNTLLTVAGLDRRRYQVDLLGGPGALERQARAAADRCIVLPWLRRSLLGPGDLRAAASMWRQLAGYDVVHTHGSKAGVLGRLLARAQQVPAVVHTIHGFPVHDYMHRRRRQALLAVERAAGRCADRIVCVCDANAREAIALGIARPGQVRVVVSGVPSGLVRSGSGDRVRGELGIPPGAPLVGTVTRLMEQKAPLDFVAAARRLLAVAPDAHVLMVGDGPLRDLVAAAAADIPRLHLLGFRGDVPDVLAAVDVVAFSSLWEGLGRALTEAVLAGKPVVATAVNGVPDLVVDGRNGYLTRPGQPDALAARILDVLALPDRGAAMGAAGSTRLAGRFEVEEMLAGIDALYQELLQDRPGRSGP
jgi:glycosyltransferase involved in cell wall biosynthesis